MKIKYFLAYCLSYGVWAAWHLTGGISPSLGLAASLIIDTAVKALVWLCPMLLVLNRKKLSHISLQESFRTPFPWFPTLIALCLTAAILHTAHIFLSGINVWGIFQPYWIFVSLTAAVIEEIAFRGCLFNGQAAVCGFKKAAIMNGVLFAVYHYPEFLLGQGFSAVFGLRFWVITVMGIVFSYMFYKWKNLTMNIVIHFVWNMLCFWFALA